jgi:6-phosphogluconolactonase
MRIVRPALDFAFLGMGEDGHVASIFPGDNAEESPSIYYRPVMAPKPPAQRITLVMHAILAARNVWVLASGRGKEEALGKSLTPGASTPLGRVVGGRDFTKVFTDIPGK